ncbi:unnamed protein product [Polarella glacialis]|uniref:Fucosyltransferase n=1 Tax=Polarella glacialis TaxID=89957 RepID=A0A813L8F7_POLGL|nr:unnamed protein product [Polarella glacialis]
MDDLRKRPLSVSVYSASYHGDFGPFHAGEVGASGGCLYSCSFLGRSQQPADVMMVSAQDRDMPRFPKKEGQVWIGHHWEAPSHYEQLMSDTYMKNFDYTSSYRSDSTIPVYGMMWDTTGNWSSMMGREPTHSFAEKSQQKYLMSAWISNCFIDQSQRMSLLEALEANSISVASYGNCRRNVEVSSETKAATRGNARCPHYHTEKIYHALVAGSVPVYVGDATIESWVPKGSYISADDFKTPQELALYMKKETLYKSYLAWRQQPLPAWVEMKIKASQNLGEVSCTTALRFGLSQSTAPGDINVLPQTLVETPAFPSTATGDIHILPQTFVDWLKEKAPQAPQVPFTPLQPEIDYPLKGLISIQEMKDMLGDNAARLDDQDFSYLEFIAATFAISLAELASGKLLGHLLSHLSAQELTQALAALDKNGDQEIDFKEFMHMIRELSAFAVQVFLEKCLYYMFLLQSGGLTLACSQAHDQLNEQIRLAEYVKQRKHLLDRRSRQKPTDALTPRTTHISSAKGNTLRPVSAAQVRRLDFNTDLSQGGAQTPRKTPARPISAPSGRTPRRGGALPVQGAVVHSAGRPPKDRHLRSQCPIYQSYFPPTPSESRYHEDFTDPDLEEEIWKIYRSARMLVMNCHHTSHVFA